MSNPDSEAARMRAPGWETGAHLTQPINSDDGYLYDEGLSWMSARPEAHLVWQYEAGSTILCRQSTRRWIWARN
jgi:hypothetical protein